MDGAISACAANTNYGGKTIAMNAPSTIDIDGFARAAKRKKKAFETTYRLLLAMLPSRLQYSYTSTKTQKITSIILSSKIGGRQSPVQKET